MTRIVAGLARGRRLKVPPEGTRPTSDRVREAVFNTLDSLGVLDGARVLDLYAGSGALGLEALSRGAASAVFVEADRRAGDVIAANIAGLGVPGGVLARRSVAQHLASPPDSAFDLVFSDPPYALGEDAITADLRALLVGGWLAADALVVLERSARGPDTDWPDGYDVWRCKRYGETQVEFADVPAEVTSGAIDGV